MFSQHLKTKENPSFIALVYSEVATIISCYFILRYFLSRLGGSYPRQYLITAVGKAYSGLRRMSTAIVRTLFLPDILWYIRIGKV